MCEYWLVRILSPQITFQRSFSIYSHTQNLSGSSITTITRYFSHSIRAKIHLWFIYTVQFLLFGCFESNRNTVESPHCTNHVTSFCNYSERDWILYYFVCREYHGGVSFIHLYAWVKLPFSLCLLCDCCPASPSKTFSLSSPIQCYIYWSRDTYTYFHFEAEMVSVVVVTVVATRLWWIQWCWLTAGVWQRCSYSATVTDAGTRMALHSHPHHLPHVSVSIRPSTPQVRFWWSTLDGYWFFPPSYARKQTDPSIETLNSFISWIVWRNQLPFKCDQHPLNTM